MGLDAAALAAVTAVRHPLLTAAALGVTALGSAAVTLVFITTAALLGRRTTAARLAAAAAVGAAAETLLNLVVARPRPAVTHLVPAVSSAFPSGHATLAFAVATVVDGEYPRLRWYWFGLASLVAVSRVYLGVHHPSDVLAGAAVGVAAGSVARRLPLKAFYSWMRTRLYAG